MTNRALKYLIQPFDPALEDDRTTEIVVNKCREMAVEARGKWTFYEDHRLTFDTLDAIGILSAYQTGQDFGPHKPVVGAALPDGQRIQICRPPATAPDVISITIRRPPSFHPTVGGLADEGLFDESEPTPSTAIPWMDEGLSRELTRAVVERKNILIAGAVGSGKTTLAKALIEAIPLEERLVTIEDTPEWNDIPHRNRVALFYSKGNQGTTELKPEDLLEASLRMRPDRVLMQELRDGAAFSYIRGVVAGHPGAITTLHAGSALGAFDALRLMVRQHPAGATLKDPDVRDLLRTQIDIVVHCERKNNIFRVNDVYRREQ